MKLCENCKNVKPYASSERCLQFVHPVNGRPLIVSCKNARESELYCGAEAKHFEPQEPEKPKLSPLQEEVKRYLLEQCEGWYESNFEQKDSGSNEIMQALEGKVLLPEKLTEADIEYFKQCCFSDDRIETIEGWLAWKHGEAK